MVRKLLPAAALAVSFGLAGCQSNPSKPEAPVAPPAASLPDWVMNPTVEGGIAATECVPATGDMSLDKAEAAAIARAGLAKQLDLRVKAMDETYARKVKAETGTVTGGTFESVSKQVADTRLQGSRPVKVDYITIEQKRNLCVMVAMDPKLTKELFDAIIAGSAAKVDAQSKEVLYEEFKAYKAQERLEQATRQ